MKNKIIYIALLLVASITLNAQMVTKAKTVEVILKGGTLHTVSAGDKVADLHIKNGKIMAIGNNLSSTTATTVDCTGKHVYPGMIDGGTRLGLSEIGAVSLTNDYNELGDFIPHMKALTAVNPNSVSIPVTRVNGVTTVLAMPAGGVFPGTSALINLIGYTPGQMSAGYQGVIMNFPSSGKRGRWDRRSEEDIKKDAEKANKKINDIWDKAMLYAKIDSAAAAGNQKRNDYNPQMDALLPVVRGEAKLLVEVNKENDILSALKWIKEKGIDAALMGVRDGWKVADKIAEAGLPVICGPVLGLPGRSSDRYDVIYKNPGKMLEAGVKVAIRTRETENVRNLPFNAGFAAAYGMGKEAALKAVTLTPAEIFGVADMLGSLDEGKVANLFVSDGDPFEPKTTISHLYISGRDVPMESRHTLLYNEFLERDPGLQK